MTSESHLTSMTVSLPHNLKDFVKAQSVSAGCSTPSEYIRRLIHADMQRQEQETLERKILEGLASPKTAIDSDDWKDLRASLRQALNKQNPQ